MGLKQDLAELADRIKKAAPNCDAMVRMADLSEIAAELRGIAKGLPEEQPAPKLFVPGQGQDWQDVAKVRAGMESRQAKIRERQNEAMSAGMVLCVGGPADDTHVAVNGEAPVGSALRVCGALYKLGTDGKLHYQAVTDRK
jgi:hypothetical protein